MNFKPIIFIAFANDKVDNTAYLRNLSLEQHGIRKSLAEAVSSGLCEIIERSSTRISDIIDVFQDPIYGPRISIFHYGGHANGFSLLLESEDGTKSITHKEGLIPFFARQENLKLIFLNGCSSEGQAIDLLKAGIPAVIGTTASINDEIATGLAVRFYGSLGAGSSISKAWADATDEIKIKHGTGNTRALNWQGKEEVSDRFPWVIQFKAGAEIIKDWNLPDISGNPLYGLPSIPPSFNLPESPFLYLNRYERKHAEVYFGRSYFVRSLFWSVMDHQSPPIILLCGQSGTGKSSLLEAGLQPRLESKYDIIYLRRNGILGLSTTLFNALLEKAGFTPTVSVITESKSYNELDTLKEFVSSLSDTIKSQLQPIIEKLSTTTISQEVVTAIQDQKPESILAAWKLVESKSNKPLLVILDQLEEAYTRPNTTLGNEMNQLFLDLKSSFGNPSTLPQGKILLSYRKEYQAEIEEHCKKHELPRSKVFIEHITKSDILELFHGFIQSARLKSRYNLTIEEGLPEIIAEDLAADKDTPIAPMLQVLLTKMWKKASSSKSQSPAFTHSLYQKLKEEGLAMDEFLANQIQSIKKKLPEQVESGLVLDMLAFHCTPNNTSAARSEKDLNERYPYAKTEANKVLAACKEYFLITDLEGIDRTAMLAHDTLGKSVIKAQQKSTLPIQQGKRILAARIEAIKAGSAFATMDSWELKLIEKIQTFLPAFNQEEKNLFDTSRKEIIKQERLRKAIVNSGRIITALSILTGVVAWYLFAKSIKHEKDSFVSLMTVSSGMNIIKDPTLSIHQALNGLEKDSSSLELKKLLLSAYYHSDYYKLAWYKVIYKSSPQITDLIYNPLMDLMIPFSETDSLVIIDDKGKINGTLKTAKNTTKTSDKNQFIQIRWTGDGQNIIALDRDFGLYFFSNDGILIKHWIHYTYFEYNDTINQAIALRYNENEDDALVDFFDAKGNKIDSFNILQSKLNNKSYQIGDFAFTGNGKNLLITQYSFDSDGLDDGGRLHLLNLDTKKRLNVSWPGSEYYISSSGKLFMNCNAEIGGILPCFIRDMNGVVVGKLSKYINNEILFHPNDSMYLYYADYNNTVISYNRPLIKGYAINHEKEIINAHYSPLNNRILTGGTDNIGKISTLQGALEYSLSGHSLPVTGIEMNRYQNTAFTGSLDGTIRSWDLVSFDHISLHQPGYINRLMPDPSGNYIFVPAQGTGQSKVYNIKTNKEVNWICPMYDRYDRWFFLDSAHIIGVVDGQTDQQEKTFIHLFRPQVDTPILLLNARCNDVGLLQHQIVITKKDSLLFMSLDGLLIKSVGIDSNINRYSGASFSTNQNNMAIAFSRRVKTSAPFDDVIAVFDQNGLKIHETKSAIHNLKEIHFSRQNDRLASIASDGSIEIVYLDGRPSIFHARQDCSPTNGGFSILQFHFAPDDALMVSSTSDGLIRTWDSLGNMITSFQSNLSNKSTLQDANFTTDGKMIYSYDGDTTLNLWDLNGNLLHSYNGHTALFTNDSHRFYTIKSPSTESNPFVTESEIRDYLTPQGAYHYFKSNKTFQKPTDNSLRTKWRRLLEWLRLG